jgi:hypothetical protein
MAGSNSSSRGVGLGAGLVEGGVSSSSLVAGWVGGLV